MPIPTDVNVEQDFEVVDAQDLAPPGANPLAFVEQGLTQLTLGVQIHNIVFTVAKFNAQYLWDEAYIENTADDPILNLEFNISAHDANGFTIVTSGKPDTGNYFLRWKVRIPTAIGTGTPIAPAVGGVVSVAASGGGGISTNVTNPTTSPNISVSISDAALTRKKTDYTKISLAGGTALTLGNWYYDTLTNNRTLTFTGSPSASMPATILELTVTGGPWTLTIPQSFPSGEVGSVTSRLLQNGNYVAVWNYTNGQYTLDDSFDVATQTGEVITGLKNLTLFSGSPTYDLGNAANVTGGLDKISSTRGSILYRGAGGWAGANPGTSGFVWTSNGSAADPTWQQSTAGSGTPGGSNKMVQFNDNSAFGGSTGFLYDKSSNIFTIPSGSSSANQINVGGVIFDYYASASSVHTNNTDDDLFTDTIAANILALDGSKIAFEYDLTTVHHTTATAEIKVWFAGTAIYTTGALNYPSTNGQVHISGFIIRDGSTSVRYRVTCEAINATLTNVVSVGRLTGITTAGANILKVTGAAANTNAAAADIVGFAGVVSWYPKNIIGSGGAAPTYLINQNFETPTTGFDNGEAWTTIGTNVTPNYTGIVLLGSQSLRLNCLGGNEANQAASPLFASQTDCWAFCKFRIEGRNGSTGDRQFVLGTGAADSAAMLVESGGTVKIFANGGYSSASATTLSDHTLYNVWLHFVQGGTCELAMSTSTTRPSVDGSGNVYLTKTGGASDTATRIACYDAFFAGGDFIFDHVLVSSSSIGNNP